MDDDTMVVACLCAAWCDICTAWRPEFDALARRFPGVRFTWIDIEDEADALDDFEPENFPVLAVQRGAALLYCATVPQHVGTWERLIEAHLSGQAPSCPAQALPDLRGFV